MSKHLQAIIEKNNQLSNMQVAFLDIEKYSQRRTSNQVSIINEFTNCLHKTLKEIGQEFIDFIQKNDFNFKTDLIIIPTGDGAAVNFTFEGLHNIHIKFAEAFLKNEFLHNQSSQACEKFDKNGWCNCHSKFNVRIGIAEGKAIIYKDINNNYNIAGNPINMAARLLGQASRNQIVLTESAYKQIIDLEEDPNYGDKFIEIKNVTFKHELKMNIYILKSDKEYINSELSDKHIRNAKLKIVSERMQELSFANANIDLDSPESSKEFGQRLSEMASVFSELFHVIDDEKSEILAGEAKPKTQIPIINQKTRRGK